MKTLLTILCIFSVGASALAQNLTTLQQAKEVVKELNIELKSAKLQNISLKEKLETATLRVKDAELQTKQVQDNADALKAWGVEQQNQAFAFMEKLQKALKRYHTLKNIASIVAGLFGLMFGLWLMRFVPPVYAAYAFALPVVCIVAASASVWLFL